MPVMIVGFLICALLVGEIVYELGSGKLLARGWKVFARREENPMLYWSSIVLQIVVALFVLCIVVLAVFGTKN